MKEDTCEYHDCKYPDESFDSSIYKLRRTVHHIDGNHENNNPKNLMVVHFGCHLSLHGKARVGEKHPMFGKHLSEEAKRKISVSLKGRHHSEETRKRISEANKGRKHSEETKKKISDNSAKYWRGKELTEEMKEKMSRSHQGQCHSGETKKKISESLKGRRLSEETIARRVLSRKMGKENYAKMKDKLLWNGSSLIEINEVVEEILSAEG